MKVLLLLLIITTTAFPLTVAGLAHAVHNGTGYHIDEEAANETVDKLQGYGVSLFQLLAGLSHTAVGGSVDTFYPYDVDPLVVVGLSVVVTVVAVFGIAMAIGGKISKMIMIVILSIVVIFMFVPLFQGQAPA